MPDQVLPPYTNAELGALSAYIDLISPAPDITIPRAVLQRLIATVRARDGFAVEALTFSGEGNPGDPAPASGPWDGTLEAAQANALSAARAAITHPER